MHLLLVSKEVRGILKHSKVYSLLLKHDHPYLWCSVGWCTHNLLHHIITLGYTVDVRELRGCPRRFGFFNGVKVSYLHFELLILRTSAMEDILAGTFL